MLVCFPKQLNAGREKTFREWDVQPVAEMLFPVKWVVQSSKRSSGPRWQTEAGSRPTETDLRPVSPSGTLSDNGFVPKGFTETEVSSLSLAAEDRLDFDGVNDYVQFYYPNIDIYTMSCSVKFDDPDTDRVRIMQRTYERWSCIAPQ